MPRSPALQIQTADQGACTVDMKLALPRSNVPVDRGRRASDPDPVKLSAEVDGLRLAMATRAVIEQAKA